MDERLGRLRVRRRCGNARGKYRDSLRAGRQRTDDVDALHGTQLTDLLEADLKFSRCDHSAYRVGLDFLAFCLIWSAIPSFGNSSVER